MDGPRHIWWNFVSSRKDRIEQAKAEWTAGHFQKVPGDEIEVIPLPATQGGGAWGTVGGAGGARARGGGEAGDPGFLRAGGLPDQRCPAALRLRCAASG